MRIDLSMVRVCAEASAADYTAPTLSLCSETCHVRLEETIDRLTRTGRLVIAFRGTKDWRDVVTDLFVVMAYTPNGRVHRGFQDAYQSVRAKVAQAVRDFKLRCSQAGVQCPIVWITGHSLGGAQAVLCAVDLAAWCEVTCVTFGQPRVGDHQFAKSAARKLKGRHLRFVNQEDMVPRLAWFFGGFRHSGDFCFLPPSGRMVQNPSMIRLALWDIKGTWRELTRWKIAQAEDHFMAHYQARMFPHGKG